MLIKNSQLIRRNLDTLKEFINNLNDNLIKMKNPLLKIKDIIEEAGLTIEQLQGIDKQTVLTLLNNVLKLQDLELGTFPFKNKLFIMPDTSDQDYNLNKFVEFYNNKEKMSYFITMNKFDFMPYLKG